MKADKLTDPVDVRLFRACGVVQAPDGGAHSFDESQWGAPGDVAAIRWRRTWIYRRGAGASCGEGKKIQAGSGREGPQVVGVGLAPRGVVLDCGLAADLLGYALAVYPRGWSDRRLPVANYPQEYGDRSRGYAAYPREYADRLRRLAAHR